MDNLLTLGILVGVAFLAVLSIFFIFSRMYQRASKERAFVRTGMGGEKVVMDGGALVFPILHEIIPIGMNTMKLLVERRNNNSLITKDRLRVDVTAEFFVRVGKRADAIATAAQTLGVKTLEPEELKSLVEGKFVDALRSVAASMEMLELHEQRKQFVQAVQDAVQVDLEKNGLELEAVSLTGLDQTAREYFNEANAFDAEGLTKLTQQTELRRKQRNEIEQNTRVEIETKRVEAQNNTLTVQQQGRFAELEQQRQISEQEAKTASQIAVATAEQEQVAETAEITRQAAVQKAEIQRQAQIEIAEQERSISISEKSEVEAAARAKADEARARQVEAAERVETARATEIANREKSIAVIEATREAEQKSVGIRVAAEAEKAAATDRAAAITTQAEAEANRQTLLAQAIKATALAEADGLTAKNAAENSLSAEAMGLRERLALISNLGTIITAAVKPLENIDSIRIIEGGGLIGGTTNGGTGSNGNPMGALVDSALTYSASKPLVDEMVRSLGLGDNLAEAVNGGAQKLFAGQTVETVVTSVESGASEAVSAPKPRKPIRSTVN